MNYLACLTLLCFAATSAHAKSFKASHPGWMVGEWVWLNRGEHYSPVECNADHNVTYHRDGSYDFMDESGYWRVEGGYLIETMTSAGGTGDPADQGKPSSLLIERKGPGIVSVHGQTPGTMIRCPAR
jgi:hypothetical protein